jgi:hypothetical protein
MQAVLAPANGNYYERLLEEALEAGLKDSRLLLGLLWHAPQGEVRQQPQGLAFLEELLNKRLSQEDPEWWWPEEEEEAGLSGVALPVWGGAEEAPSEIPAPSDPVVREMSSFGGARPDMPPGSAEDLALDLKTARGQMRDWFAEMSETWREVFQFSQDNLLVERRRYEAMIYELGKLGVWQEISRRERRENQLLKEQLESQWQRELNYLRQLLKKKR